MIEPGYTLRGANLFSLRRGYVGPPEPKTYYEADEALFAGMKATKKSVFFLSPGMTTGIWPYTYAYSGPLVDEIADRLANGVDVKFAWGDTVTQR